MAVSVLSNPVDYNMTTAEGAHAYMLALHGHLTKVGLARVMTGDDYDLNGDGTQLPTTFTETSGWLAYNFTDVVQGSYPITVWFRLVRGRWAGTTTGDAWGTQYRVSEGVVGGVPQGANFETFDGATGQYSTSTYACSFNSALGDFVRYDGNSLTVLLGVNGWTVNYSSHRTSLLELHIERRYSATTGEVERGFTGWVTPGGPTIAAPPQWISAGISYASNTNPTSRPTVFVASEESANNLFTTAHSRPTDSVMTLTGGAAVVAPIWTLDAVNRPTVFGKLYTGVYAVMPNLSVLALDFTGVEKKYLSYRPVTSNMAGSVFTFLFEWE